MKVALVTPWLPHLPFHPSSFLGYGAAILAERYDLKVMDLNAEFYFRYHGKLKRTLEAMDKTPSASDVLLYPLFDAISKHIDKHYAAIFWTTSRSCKRSRGASTQRSPRTSKP